MTDDPREHPDEPGPSGSAGPFDALRAIESRVEDLLLTAHQFVLSQPGMDFTDKLQGLPESGRALVEESRLLHARLRMIALSIAPGRITAGPRVATNVARPVRLAASILATAAERAGVAIDCRVDASNTVELHESFELVPLILLQRAIGACEPGGTVHVEGTDERTGVHVEIRWEGRPLAWPGSDPVDAEAPDSGATTGLGETAELALARRIATESGFEIGVEGEERRRGEDAHATAWTNTVRFTVA